MTESTKSAMPLGRQLATMKWNFWICNLIEAFERLAFFGVRAIAGLYMTQDNGLGLSQTDRGMIFGIWALIQCLVPMVSGGFTEAYGYRLTMMIAFIVNIVGYWLMTVANGYWVMLLAACLVGFGTAIFKPPVQGSVAKSLHEKNSGLGFGIFYWMVNIGGFFAPMIASAIRGDDITPTWNNVFYGAMIVTAINFLPTIFLYKDPKLDPEARNKKPVQVFMDTMNLLWKDQQLLRFLLIISGFWMMFMQLWDQLPIFIKEWVDTRDFGATLTSFFGFFGISAKPWLQPDGAAKAEMLINIDSFAIIILVLPISWFLGRFRMMTVLVVGIAISVVGFTCSGLFMAGNLVAIMIFVFALGEITCSPKFTEYIGMIAPPDKKAIYLGYSNIPFAIGWAFGNWTSGPLYDWLSSRSTFAREWLVENANMAKEAVDKLEGEELLNTIATRLGPGADKYQAIDMLWERNHPYTIWLILGSIGFLSLLAMLIMYLKSPKESDTSVAEAAEDFA